MKLEDIVNLKLNKAILTKKHNMKYIGLEHINKETLDINGYGNSQDVESDKYIFNKGDILVGKLRPYFHKVVLSPFDGVCSTEVWVLTPKEGYTSNQIFPIIASKRFIRYITKTSTGTRMPRADWNASKRFNIDPKILENSNEDISLISEKIQINKEIINTLEEYSQLLFHKWFVDFNFPDESGNPYKDSGGKMVEVNGKMIPKGWEQFKIKDITELNNGLNYSPVVEGGKPQPIISVTQLGRSPIIAKHSENIVNLDINDLEKYKIKKDDIIIARSANPGELSMAIEDMDAVHSGFTIRAKVMDKKMNYIVFFNLSKLKKRFSSSSTGTIMKNVTQNTLGNMTLLKCNNELIRNFNERCDALFEKISLLQEENELLTETRDLLIKKLIK